MQIVTIAVCLMIVACAEAPAAPEDEVVTDQCGLEAVVCPDEAMPPVGDVSVGPVRRCRTQTVVTTAYNYVRAQTDASPCHSANGEDVCSLHAAGDYSCAATFPFGTRLIIPEFGVCTVRDRLAPRERKGWRVDIGFGGADTVRDAFAWGRQKRSILVCVPTREEES